MKLQKICIGEKQKVVIFFQLNVAILHHFQNSVLTLVHKVVQEIIIIEEDAKQLNNLLKQNNATTYKMLFQYVQIVLIKMQQDFHRYMKFMVIVVNVFYQLF